MNNSINNPDDNRVDMLTAIRRHWLLALVLAALAGGPLFALSRLQPPVYRSEATIRIVDLRRPLTAEIEQPETLLGRADHIRSQLQVLQGWDVLSEIVDREPLLRLRSLSRGVSPGEFGDVWIPALTPSDTVVLTVDSRQVRATFAGEVTRAPLGNPVHLGGMVFSVPAGAGFSRAEFLVLPRDEAVERLRKDVRVQPVEQTDAVVVTFTHRDPELARRIANALVQTFSETTVRAAQNRSLRRRTFLEEQLAYVDAQLGEVQMALTSFRSGRQVYSARDRMMAQQQGLFDLEIRRQELATDLRMYQMLVATLTGSPREAEMGTLRALVSSPGLASNPVVSQLFAQLLAYETEREQLTTGPTAAAPENPAVLRLNGLVSAAQARLVESISSHIAALDARLEALNHLETRTAAGMRDLPVAEAVEVRLLQQNESLMRMSDQLRGELHQARMAEAVLEGRVEIVSPASPSQPINRRGLMATMALFIGLIAGLGGALAYEARYTSLRRKKEIEALFRVPGLAVIPRLPGPRAHWAGLLTAVPGAGERSMEVFRMLRTNVVHSRVGKGVRTIAVTSAAPGEGKTTTALNLAMACASNGSRVLLLDGDCYRGRLWRLLDADEGPGLADVLEGLVPLTAAIQQTSPTGLFLMTAGARRAAPTLEQAREDDIRRLIGQLTDQFDLVIIDTPPLLSAADASILSTMVDGVLLVIRAGQTEKEAAALAGEQLSLVGACLLGTIINDPRGIVPEYKNYAYGYGEVES
jgi:polysaccharide biosynthesis transport protein